MEPVTRQDINKLTARPRHASYMEHRRQMIWQVILPVVLAALLMAGLIVWICLATFQGQGEVGRWAAISTIWIILPLIIVALIAFLLLCGLVYLMARLLHLIPTYTGIAQDYAFRAEAVVKRTTATAVRPIFMLDEIGARFRAFIGRITHGK